MQRVAAYLFERVDDMVWAEARAAEQERLKAVATAWLRAKGGDLAATSGTFSPEDGSKGAFCIEEASDGERGWWSLQLTEETRESRRFATSLWIVEGTSRVSVYATLETGWTSSHIVPVNIDPKCPRAIRELLSLPGAWYHGSTVLRPKWTVLGFDEGEGLAAEIERPARTVPVVVVSHSAGNSTLPDLHQRLAYDLAGLANVVAVDEDASWALSDVLGRDFSCFHGGVRLYWPHFLLRRDTYLHPLWTADRQKSSGYGPVDASDRLRRQLRSLLFRAAALSVIRPLEIDAVRDARAQRTVAQLRARAASLEEFQSLAESYAAANDELRAENASLSARSMALEAQLASLEGDKAALLAHLRAAKGGSVEEVESGGLAPDTGEIAPAVSPAKGETRFYKKVHSKGAYDVLVPVQDCGCDRWEGAHAADKARKGVAKLEGRSDWNTMQHCGSCTGGGMWRVKW